MKKNLFIGFDDTIVKTRPLVSTYMNQKYGIETTENDWLDNDQFDEVINSFRKDQYPVTREDVYLDLGREFFHTFDLKSFHFFEDAIKTIIELSHHYCLYIVTSRQKSEKKNLEILLKKGSIYNCFSGIHCVWNYDESKGEFTSFPKWRFIESVKNGIPLGVIDDSKKELEQIGKRIWVPTLFNPKDNNQKKNIEIARNWQDILNIFCVEKKYWPPCH
jgi:hypothetical protein